MNRIDIAKVYRENVKPGLTAHEASAMERSLAAPPLRSIVTKTADGEVCWYVLLPRSKRHGVASSMQEAQDIIDRILMTDSNTDSGTDTDFSNNLI